MLGAGGAAHIQALLAIHHSLKDATAGMKVEIQKVIKSRLTIQIICTVP
jgi:hypothetical protein